MVNIQMKKVDKYSEQEQCNKDSALSLPSHLQRERHLGRAPTTSDVIRYIRFRGTAGLVGGIQME